MFVRPLFVDISHVINQIAAVLNNFQASGGVLVTASDIDAAFRFLDSAGKGKLTIGSLRQKLAAFFPGIFNGLERANLLRA